MVHPYLLRFVLVVAALALAACEPYDFHYAPATAGHVVSATTHRPVVGAVVSVSAEKQSVQTQTDQNGAFSLPRLHHWGILTLSDGYVGGIGVLRVEARGYRTYTEEDIGSPAGYHQVIRHVGSNDAHESPDWEHIHVTLTPGA